jgi:hypothetical protein
MTVGPGHFRHAPYSQTAPHGWILPKFAYADTKHPQGASVYWDEHELEHPKESAAGCPKWEWADLDGSNSSGRKGILYRAPMKPWSGRREYWRL